MNKITRKGFLKKGAGLASLIYLDKVKSLPFFPEKDIPRMDKKHQKAFYVNTDACVGCRACVAVCQEYYNIPYPLSFRKVYPRESNPTGEDNLGIRRFMSLACNHCKEPACLKGCPTKSYAKRPEDGIVVHNQDTCIGCKYCTWTCPYGVPQFNPKTHKIFKCELCVERLDHGEKPLCTSSCIAKAIDYGTIEELENRYGPRLARMPSDFLFPDTNISEPTTLFMLPKGDIPALAPIEDRALDREVNKPNG